MKVLWLSNVLFPEVCEKLNVPTLVVGGWMYSGAKALLKYNPEIKLAVAANYIGTDFKVIEGKYITYYLIPISIKKSKSLEHFEIYYKRLIENFNPEIVHIHGTEYPNTLTFLQVNGANNIIVSIQGLVNIIAKYYIYGLNNLRVSFRDLIRNDSLKSQQKSMTKRGVYEQELITKTHYHIGRTSWDKSNLWAINPKSKYFFCNETLRDGFYKAQWKVEECNRHTIFLSQAHYPIKGLHKLLEALPIVLRQYPNTKVLVAGNDFLNQPWYRKNGYACYIQKLIIKNRLNEKVQFLGVLTESKMIEQYQKAHVFVCPSSIENSPNSVGEAQLIGTPCIASYVGGTMDMITDGQTGFLYRFEETALLAYRICELFADDALATKLSLNSRKVAAIRHDKENNARKLNEIYENIFQLIQNQK